MSSIGAIRALETASESCSARGGALSASPLKGVVASSYFRWKGFLDMPLAAALLVLAAPLIGLLWLFVKCSSRGPGFYGQRRTGMNGQEFTMYKLRTMRVDAEAGTGAVWSAINDPRVTRLGRVLRKLHLDELPQLYNVLKGEMALVGPRPERPEFVKVLGEKLADYDDRHCVRPGITGLAQLNLPPDTDLNSVTRKLVLDLEYIREATAWFEARMLLCTFTRIFKLPTIGLLGLNRVVQLPEPEARLAMTPAMIELVAPRGVHSSEKGPAQADGQQTQNMPRPKARVKSHIPARLS